VRFQGFETDLESFRDVATRLRYFDPNVRVGLPEDVAALGDTLTADSTAVTPVNLNPVESRTITFQAGAYGEHWFIACRSAMSRNRSMLPVSMYG